jgi:predicted RNA-binding protein with PUA-like domain
MAANYWLVKQEPEAYAWSDMVREGETAWTGVRNFQARNHLRAMRRGDLVLFYHSVSEKRIVGLARVTRPAYPDPTATEGDWSAVDLAPVKPLREPVTLETIKADPALAGLPLLRQSRLSVVPVTPQQFDRLLEHGRTSC